MASIVCQQGLQSSLEPRFIEPRTFGLKLAPPKPLFLQSLEWAAVSVPTPTTLDSISNIEDHNNKNVVDDNETITITNIKSNVNDNGGWDFIQALENSSKSYINEAKKVKETPYVHPLVKRYSSKLSEKSLELCTENLGCETGSDIGEYSDVYSNSSSDSEDGKSLTRDVPSFRRNSSTLINKKKKVKVITNCGGNLPPPLTSISGSNCIQVRAHREGGRLVIKTFVVPSSSSHSCFKAERRDGHLLLHSVNNYDSNHHAFEQQPQEQEQVEEEKQEVEECEHDEADKTEVEEYEHDEAEDEQEMDEEAKEEEEYIFFGEDMDGNDCNGGDEMGIEKFQRPSRCKESGGRGKNGLLIWEPFWVAT